MTTILDQICATKRQEIAISKASAPEAVLQAQLAETSAPRGFYQALRQKIDSGNPALIAEIKRASPSQGRIREDFDPATHARDYEAGGATCLSVLTDHSYFQGNPSDLRAARVACALPVIRKDFMLDPYQILESRAMGADCVLLILSILSDAQALELFTCARELGMDTLIEIHDESELERAIALPSPLIGVNNRNLSTMKIDVNHCCRLADRIPSDRLIVCESGVETLEDVETARQHGVHSFLVGTSLMRQKDLIQATKLLLHG